MYILLVVVGLLATASAKDVIVGEGGSLIYIKNATASPTIWRHDYNLTINTTSPYEVITRVVIIDNRVGKDGEAAIVEGGVGHNNVTIELKSPAVFRGYDFEIQIYADEEHLQTPENPQAPINNDQQIVQINGEEKPLPKDKTDDIQKPVTPVPTASTTKQVPNGQDKVQHPVEAGKDDTQKVHPKHNTQEEQGEQKPLKPVPIDNNENQKEIGQVPVQKTNEFNPLPNDDDWQAIVDDIFNKQNSSQTKPNVGPSKPELPVAHKPSDINEQKPVIDINGQEPVINGGGQQAVKQNVDILPPKEVLITKEVPRKA